MNVEQSRCVVGSVNVEQSGGVVEGLNNYTSSDVEHVNIESLHGAVVEVNVQASGMVGKKMEGVAIVPLCKGTLEDP